MRFVSPKALVLDARKRGYAVPAFNTNGGSYDIMRAALEAAQESASPMILQEYEPNCAYRGFRQFAALADFLCDDLRITVPVALHLDHGKSFESVAQAMQAGFTGVMFDASHDPLEENIAKTRKVVEVARALEVAVEAEIGYVKGNEPPKEKQVGRVPVPERPAITPAKTSLAEAQKFAAAVEVDMLAVSIGTMHGVFQHQTEIDYELLKVLRKALPVPLVQHGTCGIATRDLTQLAKCGMSKINFGEPFRYNYIRYFNELADSMEHLWHAWRIQQAVKDRLKAEMKELLLALGSNNKA